jgi:hypothetical protein
MSEITPKEVLELWELTWGPLEEKWREDFLTHKDMKLICTYNYRQIDFCIRKSKKLNTLLQELKRTPLIRVAQKGTSSGGSKHVSEWGNLTVKKPGRPEAAIPGSTICPSCGVKVTANNLKCKCG